MMTNQSDDDTGLKGLNVMATVALAGLLVIALLARSWLGLTGLQQLDPFALLTSVGIAIACLMFALPAASSAVTVAPRIDHASAEPR